MATGGGEETTPFDPSGSREGFRMHTTRRTFLKGTAALAAGAGLPLHEAFAQSAIELKMHSFVPSTHVIWTDVLMPWAKDLESKTGGKVTVRFFPSMQLGGKPPELYRQAVQGVSDMSFTLPGYTSNDFPMMALTELPGMATSADDGTKKLWKNFDKFLSRDFKESKVVMLWNSDSASIMSRSKPVRTLEDMKGMKIRTPSAAQSAQLEAVGAIPIDMPANQIYNALERGVVDASMIPMSAALDFKLIEVAKYFTVNAPLGRSNFLVAMNKAKYDGLPADLKKTFDSTVGLPLSLKGADTYDKKNNAAIAAAKKDRELIELSDKENKRWLDAFKPLIKETVEKGEKAGLPARGLISAYGLTS
jgi:TRAP-type C4-dicarboxylate transport system substrate-binding protein